MRYNKNAPNYRDYVNAIKKETEVQSRYYKEIGITRNKIKRIEREIFNGVSESSERRLKKLIDYLNQDINKYKDELENSRTRQRFFEQKLCPHDFGLITNEYIDENKKKYLSGFCLECDTEFNDIEGQLFNHSIIMNKVAKTMSFEQYKRKLEKLKKLSQYSQNDYDYVIGENIVSEIMNEGKIRKKSR